MRLPHLLAFLALLAACFPDPNLGEETPPAPPNPGEDVPHVEVPHVVHAPAGDGVPNPDAPVEPPPGVEPPPSPPPEGEPQPTDADIQLPPTGGDPPVPAGDGIRLPSGYLLLDEPDPGWSALPAGARVLVQGEVLTLDRGQVRLSTFDGKTWKTLDFGPIDGGRFSVPVPRDLALPLYVSVCSDSTGDGPTPNDPVGALPEPIRLSGQDVQVTVRVNQRPDWLKELPVDAHALLSRGTVEP